MNAVGVDGEVRLHVVDHAPDVEWFALVALDEIEQEIERAVVDIQFNAILQ